MSKTKVKNAPGLFSRWGRYSTIKATLFGGLPSFFQGVSRHSFQWQYYEKGWHLKKVDAEISLIYQKHERIALKDFSAEVRAQIDVSSFIRKAHLFLNIPQTTLESIVDYMLADLLHTDEPIEAMTEIKLALFTEDSVHHPAETIQGACGSLDSGFTYEQAWICFLCSVNSIQHTHVMIARLKNPVNVGNTLQELHFVILVIVPSKHLLRGPKGALETGRTFATIFADSELRSQLLVAQTNDDFMDLMLRQSERLGNLHRRSSLAQSFEDLHHMTMTHHESGFEAEEEHEAVEDKACMFAIDLRRDFWRRWPHYLSDFTDGVCDYRSIYKTVSTIVFLYFACILPAIAFGVLNDTNTYGKIHVKKVIYAQCVGGVVFALFGGQAMIILLTTAPLALYTKVIYIISRDNGLDFLAMYACTCIFNCGFLLIYAVTGASRLMKWCTRSTEEIFALFVSITFIVDAAKDVYHDFRKHYSSDQCHGDVHATNATYNSSIMLGTTATEVAEPCFREGSLLFLLLTLGTLWFGLMLLNFTKTPYLNAGKRQLLADFALPVAVIVVSFFGSYIFNAVQLPPFPYDTSNIFVLPNMSSLPVGAVFGSLVLGFCLSLLLFMDQNLSAAMVNNPENRLQKGAAYSWDLMAVALINIFNATFGMPMMHGSIPHSPLHVMTMADVENRMEHGQLEQSVVKVRETRITGLVSHLFIGLSLLLLLPYPLAYIPRPVFDGLMLYLAVTSINNNQMFDRITLLFTEQAQYPPTHYVSRVPQKKVHLFTFLQILQLLVLCAFGFSPWPYVKLVFPILIPALLPVRHKVLPYFVQRKFLAILDR